MARKYETDQLVWNGITIEIRYCPAWISSDVNGYNTAHLEVQGD